MKILITALLTLFIYTNSLHAQNYYVSSSALSNGSGLLSNSPWNSFAPLNALLATLASIDTIFLKRGDVFRDQITVAAASNFVISSYGVGNKPEINGSDSVISWTQTPSTTYWQATFNQPVVNFFVNHHEQILARFPDESAQTPFLTVDGGTSNDTLVDAGLGLLTTSTLNESQVCVHTAEWCWEKSPVTASSGNFLIYLNPTLRVPTAGYGYFLYDHISYLTSGKEWKYDPVNQKLYYKPITGNPNTMLCEASVRPYGILLNPGVHHITISDISFVNQAESGIAILDSTSQHIHVNGCDFSGQYKYGVEVEGAYSKISQSYFREVDGLAVCIKSSGTGAEVDHNTFINNGRFRNSGIGQEINLSAIKGTFVDSCHIHHNTIDSVGYCGISMDGKWNIVERNIIQHAMLINSDGAALKSFGVGSQYNIFRNNFVSSSNGNTAGAPQGSPLSYFQTPGIYFDFSTNNCTIQDNTIYNQTKKGIFLNASTNHNTVVGNTVYGGNYLLDFNGAPNDNIAFYINMIGMTVKHNVLFAKDNDDYVLRMVDNTGGYNHGIIDSNYYFQPYEANNYAFIPPATSISFSTWLTNTGYDMHTQSSFLNWALPTSDDTLIMNQTDNVVTVSLGADKYLDLDSNTVCGSVTLAPYTSKILIHTNTLCSIGNVTEPELDLRLSVYPNPFTFATTIKCSEAVSGTSINIYNTCGKLVKQIQDFHGDSFVFNRGELPNGLYMIELSGTSKGLIRNKMLIID